jgi:hypothetical protein
MTPRELLSKLKEEHKYHFKNIRKSNFKRFLKFILPFALVGIGVLYLNFLNAGNIYYKPLQNENVQIISTSMQDELIRDNVVQLREGQGGFKLNGLFEVCDVDGNKEIIRIKDTDDLYTYHFASIRKDKNGQIKLVGIDDTYKRYEFFLAVVFVLLLGGTITSSVIFLIDLGTFIFLLISDKNTYYVSYSRENDLWTSLFYIPDYYPNYYDVPAINYIWAHCKEFFGYPLTEEYIHYWFIEGVWDLQGTWRKAKYQNV